MTLLCILAIIAAFAAGLWVGSRDDEEEGGVLYQYLDSDRDEFDEF